MKWWESRRGRKRGKISTGKGAGLCPPFTTGAWHVQVLPGYVHVIQQGPYTSRCFHAMSTYYNRAWHIHVFLSWCHTKIVCIETARDAPVRWVTDLKTFVKQFDPTPDLKSKGHWPPFWALVLSEQSISIFWDSLSTEERTTQVWLVLMLGSQCNEWDAIKKWRNLDMNSFSLFWWRFPIESRAIKKWRSSINSLM